MNFSLIPLNHKFNTHNKVHKEHPPIAQQPFNVQHENLSLQPNKNNNTDNNQDELQNPNPTLDTQSADLTVNSNALFVP